MTRQLELNTNLMTYLLSSKIRGEPKKGHARNFWIDKSIFSVAAGSFYYALVVLTLIGYGHSIPNTAFGKTFTMGYAALGIPAAMIMFQSMGERMNKAYSVIIRKVRTTFGCARTEASELDLIFSSLFTSGSNVNSLLLLKFEKSNWPPLQESLSLVEPCYIILTKAGLSLTHFTTRLSLYPPSDLEIL